MRPFSSARKGMSAVASALMSAVASMGSIGIMQGASAMGPARIQKKIFDSRCDSQEE